MMRRLLLLVLCGLFACKKAEPNTQIVISVDTDFDVPAQLDAVRFKIDKQLAGGKDDTRLDRDESLVGKAPGDFPLTLAMTSVESGKPTVRVTVTGKRRGEDVVTRQAIVSFRSGQTLALPMNLVTACEGKVCEEGFTCGDDGECESIVRDDLDPWQGRPPDLDGSAGMPSADAGPMDGGGAGDGGSNAGPEAGAVDAGKDAGGDEPAPARIRDLAVGFYHSCALLMNGRVACWGGNARRELGYDTQAADCPAQGVSCSVDPQLVEGLQNAVEIGAGERFTCALTSAGEVYCWGTNSGGQLGNGDNSGSFAAQRVRFQSAPAEPSVILTGVDQLAVGRSQACARVASTHALVCWGGEPNEKSQIPTAGSSGTRVAVATDITSGVEQVVLGHSHGCFIDPDSALWCWGWNESAQMGLDPETVAHTTTPNRVIENGVTEVAAGGAHTCAVVSGQVRCFGSAYAGQLGFGPVPDGLPECLYGACTTQVNPVDNVISSPVQQLALADFTSCARYENGRVACWGSGYMSVVGQPGEASALSPTYLFADPRKVRVLAGFAGHFCLSVEDRPSEVLCWGSNPEGGLGANGTLGTSQPELAVTTLDAAFDLP